MFNSLPVALGCLHNPVNYPVHLFFHDLYSALIAFSYFFFKKKSRRPAFGRVEKNFPISWQCQDLSDADITYYSDYFQLRNF